jgi:hypothetical protein
MAFVLLAMSVPYYFVFGLSLIVFGVLSCANAIVEGRCWCYSKGSADATGIVLEEKDGATSVPAGMVLLHVYDLHHLSWIQLMNDILLLGRIGGAFHTGVEIFGAEWGYGYLDEGGSGVYHIPPKSNTDHRFRLTLPLGKTPVDQEGLTTITERFSKEWDSAGFCNLKHNCVDFCEVLCKELRVLEVPRWVLRGHRFAAAVLGNTSAEEQLPHDAAELEREIANDARNLAW